MKTLLLSLLLFFIQPSLKVKSELGLRFPSSISWPRELRASIELNRICPSLSSESYDGTIYSCSGCPELIEKVQLKKYSKLITRKNKDELVFKLKSGQIKSLKNDPIVGENK